VPCFAVAFCYLQNEHMSTRRIVTFPTPKKMFCDKRKNTHLQLLRIDELQGVPLDGVQCRVGGVTWVRRRGRRRRFDFAPLRDLLPPRQALFHHLKTTTDAFCQLTNRKIIEYSYLGVAVLIMKMSHQREPFPLHIITTVPLTDDLFTTFRTVRFAHVQVHLIGRLELGIPGNDETIITTTSTLARHHLQVAVPPLAHERSRQIPDYPRLDVLHLLLDDAVAGSTTLGDRRRLDHGTRRNYVVRDRRTL
jgi:hypothetical protein